MIKCEYWFSSSKTISDMFLYHASTSHQILNIQSVHEKDFGISPRLKKLVSLSRHFWTYLRTLAMLISQYLCSNFPRNSIKLARNIVIILSHHQHLRQSQTTHPQAFDCPLPTTPCLNKRGRRRLFPRPVDPRRWIGGGAIPPTWNRWKPQVGTPRLVRVGSFMRCSLTWNGRCALEKVRPSSYRSGQVRADAIGRCVVTWRVSNWMSSAGWEDGASCTYMQVIRRGWPLGSCFHFRKEELLQEW